MRRRGTGRDLSLTIRMGIVLALLAALYAGLGALAVLAAVDAWRRDWRGILVPPALVGLMLLHFFSADRLVLDNARAEEVDRAEEPELVALVERLAAAADIPPPRVALARVGVANALATGVTTRRNVVAVTERLRERLAPDELEAVVAHEISHLANRDAAVLAAASSFRAVAAFFGAPELLDPDAKKDQDVRLKIARFMFAPFRWALLAVGTPLTLALSRYREFAADRGAAMLTGRPESVMSALQKLAGERQRIPRTDLRRVSAVHAFWFAPIARTRLLLLADHPPLEKRLERLARIAREMGKPA